MHAVTFQAPDEVALEEVPDPVLQAPDDVIVRVEASGICGSDLHIYHGRVPVGKGFTIGHEFVGTVVGRGRGRRTGGGRRPRARHVRDRLRHLHAVHPRRLPPLLARAHVRPRPESRRPAGRAGRALLVPHANLTLRRVPEGMSNEVALFAGDVMGTGYHSIAHAGVRAGDTVAVLGLGPVGLCAIQAAKASGAAQIFAIDTVADRLAMAERFGATPLHLTDDDPKKAVRAATGGGVDVTVDAVGDPGPLALAVSLTRDAGIVSGIGAYAGKGEVPLGLAWLKGLQLRLGLANVIAHVDRVLALMQAGILDPAPLVTHHMKLADAAEAYRIYDAREALKVVLTP